VGAAATDGGNGSSGAVEPAADAVQAGEGPPPDPVAETVAVVEVDMPAVDPDFAEAEAPKAPARKGWWNRLTS